MEFFHGPVQSSEDNMSEERHVDKSDANGPCVVPRAFKGEEFHKLLEHGAFLLMLGVVSLLFLGILKPFFSAIFWACAISIIFSPLQQRLLRRWAKPNTVAFVTLCVCVCVAVIPAFFILASFVREGTDLYQRVQDGVINPATYVDRIRQAFPALQSLLERLNIEPETVKTQLSDLAVGASKFIAHNAVQIGQNTLQFFISLTLMLYVSFFLLRDGPRLVSLMIRALPLGDEREKMLFGKFAEVTRATVKGNLVVAVVQGTLGGLIFWILGIHGALLWGVVMTFLSLIPVVGAGLIWGPVAVYLFATGDWVQGLVLVGFGAGVIGLVDNILRPILVGRDTKLPDYIVLLSTLGGFSLFGMNGFVVGPLVAVLFVAFWEIFMLEYNVSSPVESAQAGEAPSADSAAASKQE
ncbi:MAG: AI-2E family transporter [Opitutales bacterium]|nr:AI-2E family transporter [Opitutales bacterium]